MRHFSTRRGDTIVEVLLALTILAAVLAGAYVTTNKAVKTGRDAQERSEALELAKGQVELLKSFQTNPNPAVYTLSPGRTFCLYYNSTLTTPDRRALADITNVAAPAGYPAACKSGYYAMSIEDVVVAGTRFFTVRVLWESILGTTSSTVNTTTLPGYSEVKLFYRVAE